MKEPPRGHMRGGWGGKKGPRGGLGRVCAASASQQAAAVVPRVPPRKCRAYSRDSEGSWFRSLFVHKVDPRKDAHSNLLSKKETSNLYKIQCECPAGGNAPPQNSARPVLCLDPRRGSRQSLSPSFPRSSQREARMPGCLQQPDVSPPLPPRVPLGSGGGLRWRETPQFGWEGKWGGQERCGVKNSALLSLGETQLLPTMPQPPPFSYPGGVPGTRGCPPTAPCAPRREEVLPKLHLDADYPCDLVGNWNTWYGEQDQAGERILHEDRAREGGTQGLPRHPPPGPDPDAGQGEDAGRALVSRGGLCGVPAAFPPTPQPRRSHPSAPLALLGRVPGPHGLHEQAEAEQGSARAGSAPPSRRPPRAAPPAAAAAPALAVPRSTWTSARSAAACCCPAGTSCCWSSASGMSPCPARGPTSTSSGPTSSR